LVFLRQLNTTAVVGSFRRKNYRKTTNMNEYQKNEKATKAGAAAAFNVCCITV